MRRRTLVVGSTAMLSAAATLMAPAGTGARAQAPDRKIRIGILNDLSGIYADYQGRGSAIAAEMAAEEFGAVRGMAVEVIAADHQNKPDIGAQLARRWFDQDGVDVIMDVPNSAIALAVAELAREKNKVFIGSGAGTSELTGPRCTPNTVHWTYDTYALGHSLGRAVVQQGGRRWFILTADYAFGYDLEQRMADAVRAAGGQVLGTVRHPLGTTDYSSFLVRARSSGADVLGLANAGGDTTTSLKQASEFGLPRTMKMAGPIVNINVIQPIGLEDTQGLLAPIPFYWDMSDGSREFSRRFAARHPRRLMPNDMQAGCYAATLHYLKAIAEGADPSDGRAVVAAMKAMPTEDPLFGQGTIRADGRKIHPMHLWQVKAPAESRGEWDYFKHVATVPGDEAFRSLADGRCPLAQG